MQISPIRMTKLAFTEKVYSPTRDIEDLKAQNRKEVSENRKRGCLPAMVVSSIISAGIAGNVLFLKDETKPQDKNEPSKDIMDTTKRDTLKISEFNPDEIPNYVVLERDGTKVVYNKQ